MKTIFSIGMLAALATAQSLGYAQTTNPPAQKSIVQTTCKDYLAMDEVIKPKFIYYSVGHSKQGSPASVTFDVVAVDKLKPVIDEYCRSHLTASAYQKVMDESMASEKAKK